MHETTPGAGSFGFSPRGVTQSDVSHAADSLLRSGERPTNDKVRAQIGKGSLTTLGPLLDSWWKTLSARLDSGPAALHRLPESVVHVAEALWLQALEETRRRISIEQHDKVRLAELDRQRLDLRSHVLTLREGELDSRLRDRDRTIAELNRRLQELSDLLRKEQATHEFQTHQATLARREARTKSAIARAPATLRQKTRRATPLRKSTKRKMRNRPKPKRGRRGS